MPDLAALSAVLAEPTRLRILEELLGGPPLPAGALAARVGVAPSTVSGHLTRLVEAELVVVAPVGRRREARLAGPHVAEALEALMRLAEPERPTGLRAVQRDTAMRRARSCYDHLAGECGVGLTAHLVARGALSDDGGGLALGPAAPAVLSGLGVDLAALPASRRPLVRGCTDWTERRPHLAGALGAALLTALLDRGWLARRPHDRALRVTPAGEHGFTSLGTTPTLSAVAAA